MIDKTPAAPPALEFLEEDGLTLVLDPDGGTWAVVNSLGREIIALCDGERTVGTVARRISERYDVPYPEVLADVAGFLESLNRARVIFLDEAERDRFVRELAEVRAVRSARIPLRSLNVQLTRNCNLRCKHCYTPPSRDETGEISTDEITGVLRQYAGMTRGILTLTGGEPLLRADWLEILDEALAQGLQVSLFTNGTLIDAPAAEALSRRQVTVQVSLEGDTPALHDRVRGQGSHEKAWKGIRLLLDRGMADRLQIATVLNRWNVASFPAFVEGLRALGIRKIRIGDLIRQGRARDHWADLRLSLEEAVAATEIIHRLAEQAPDMEIEGDCTVSFSQRLQGAAGNCPMGASLHVDAAGEVFACLLEAEPYRLGSIREEPFSQIALRKGGTLDRLRECANERIRKIPACSRCIWRFFCGGGCMAHAYFQHGTLWREDTACALRQHTFRRLLFQEARSRSESGNR